MALSRAQRLIQLRRSTHFIVWVERTGWTTKNAFITRNLISIEFSENLIGRPELAWQTMWVTGFMIYRIPPQAENDLFAVAYRPDLTAALNI